MTAAAAPCAPAVEAFLAPLPGADPAGPPLRYEGTYDRVREARRADDPALSQGIWTHELKRADWEGAAALCEAALRERSKDLQLAGWLLEAWVRLHGFAGAAAGLEVMAGVAERFWDGMHPRAAEGGEPCEARALVVEWVDATVADALAGVPLTLAGAADAEAHPWAAREAALRLENLGRRDAAAARAAEARGAVSLARLERAVSLTATAFYAAAAASLRRGEAAAGRLQALLDARCGAAAPGLLRTREALAAVRAWTERVLAARPDAPAVPLEEEPMRDDPDPPRPSPPGVAAAAAPVPAAPPASASGPAGRDEAYRWLEAAAGYLLAAEPHSPVPYLVRRAVGWGRLPLPELMLEFQRSGYDLAALYRLLGMEEPAG